MGECTKRNMNGLFARSGGNEVIGKVDESNGRMKTYSGDTIPFSLLSLAFVQFQVLLQHCNSDKTNASG